MSTLNLSLQNVSLSRKKMSDIAETIIKGKKTLIEVRQALENHPAFKEEFQDSMSQPITTLTRCFSAMKLKDEPVHVFNGAPEVDMQIVFQTLHSIEPNLQINNLTKVLDSSTPLKTFLREHSCSTNYSFQLKKCSSSTASTALQMCIACQVKHCHPCLGYHCHC